MGSPRKVAGGRQSARAGVLLRLLPQMDALLQEESLRIPLERYGRPLVQTLLRERCDRLRVAARKGTLDPASMRQEVAGLPAWVGEEALRRTSTGLVQVINATGVILHTNLGRAPLSAEAIRRIGEVAGGYSTLEYELGHGRRGSRMAHLEGLFALLFPGRAAHVVNNNAAAMLLALNTLAEGREVVVSRGELVEIGGSFRVPEIMAKSGALLREVGTTNKTRLRDYERAITKKTGLILKVHPSNYRVVGFTAATSLRDLAVLGRRRRLPLLMDQGSGNLLDLRGFGVDGEATVQEALAEGADLVCCSGDKLLGGPQAGLLIGRAPIVAQLRDNPLARALRVDKMIFAALEAVLLSHVKGRAFEELPVARMMALDRDAIGARAGRLQALVATRAGGRLQTSLQPGWSLTGGGSAPGEGLATVLLGVRVPGLSTRATESRLRAGSPPVVARIESDALLLDLRTVLETQDTALADALAALAENPRR